MKGNEKVIERLNLLLGDELSAISQYMVHSEMCANWGYKHLHEAIEKQAKDEMRHAEKLISRILFLEGQPNPAPQKKVQIGKNIEEQLTSDIDGENDAIEMYNDAIQLSETAGDHGTADLLRIILSDEEKHVDWLETQQQLISQIGLPNYLARQMD